ncbi:uncharacterized protein LOC124186645 isoform X1 [Neodiprion fabricii]|uniref:uncharacterized protein LOC124186645 isoform X1 n=1 Tax=Neodiprion fabricii TaxID=2872261 RepID=UPI001ED94EBE|nr:uncharacterized protein LOC124186645 isoform X1 [Neodiprion fabricii]
MGFDGMRVGGGRCPPLLVGGLVLACFLLVCNWWTLSTENAELLRQIDDLILQLKTSEEDRNQCTMLRNSLEQRYKRCDEMVASLHVQIEQEKVLQKKQEDSEMMCKTELESQKQVDITQKATLDSLRVEKDALTKEVDEKKDNIKRLQSELEEARDQLSELKLTVNSPGNSKPSSPGSQVSPPRVVSPSKPNLGPVPEGAVKVSNPGQQGLLYHGIPILPRDPPGAVRQLPRLSVTMIKAPETPILSNETQNGGNQDAQNGIDAGNDRIDDQIDENIDGGEAADEDNLKNQGSKLDADQAGN